MLILALEAASKSASCCLSRDGAILAQSYQLSGLTHSTTLLPMVEDMLKNSGTDLSQVDAIAVSNGPGSFTGVRIGVSTAKGLAWAQDLPCVGVSTLEAMAAPLVHLEGAELCCCMDARRSQVYSARFRVEGGQLCRVTEDGAIALSDLAEEIKDIKEPVFLVGDGSILCYNTLSSQVPSLVPPKEHRMHQRAVGVALLAEKIAAAGEKGDGNALTPNYLRLSQAERERMERDKNK